MQQGFKFFHIYIGEEGKIWIGTCLAVHLSDVQNRKGLQGSKTAVLWLLLINPIILGVEFISSNEII